MNKLNKICGIYCIENVVNKKKYIGLSHDIEHRFHTHRCCLNSNSHINKHLQSAWNKYKEVNFHFYIVQLCNDQDLKSLERYYIKFYKSNDRKYGYNKTSGGDGIKDLEKECAEKISISESLYPVVQLDMNGQYLNTYRNCSKAGIAVSGCTENIRMVCDHKRKSANGFIWAYEKDYQSLKFTLERYTHRTTCKSLIQYDLNMNRIAEFKSAREAEKETGIGYRMISRVCRHKRPYTHGYIFRFANE